MKSALSFAIITLAALSFLNFSYAEDAIQPNEPTDSKVTRDIEGVSNAIEKRESGRVKIMRKNMQNCMRMNSEQMTCENQIMKTCRENSSKKDCQRSMTNMNKANTAKK